MQACYLKCFSHVFFSNMLAKLSGKEQSVHDAFIADLQITQRKTDNPLIIGMVGLVGSGKSTVARELAPYLEATIISGDDIRIELRKRGAGYDNTDTIALLLARYILLKGGNVIMDSDFSPADKREFLKNLTYHISVSTHFIRTICDIDIMIGRSFTGGYDGSIGEFFAGASSKWTEESKVPKGPVVKVREMMRRIPLHYTWTNEGGGKWTIKRLFFIAATIDTSDTELFKEEVMGRAELLK